MYRGDLAGYVIDTLIQSTIWTMRLLFGFVLPTLNTIALWLTALGLGHLLRLYPRLSAGGALLASVLGWTVAACLFLPVFVSSGAPVGETLIVLLIGGVVAGLAVGGQITQDWSSPPPASAYASHDTQVHPDMLVREEEDEERPMNEVWHGGLILGKDLRHKPRGE